MRLMKSQSPYSLAFSVSCARFWELFSARIASQERKEARRKERLGYLIGLLNALIRLRAQLQWLQTLPHMESAGHYMKSGSKR